MILQFWLGWPRTHRIFFLLFFVVFAAAMAWMWTAYFIEPAPAIRLQTISEADISEIPVDQFTKGPFDFIVKGNSYVILQRQLGSMLATSNTVACTYLLVLVVFVIGMLSVISTLNRFYYLVGMGLFIVFVTSLSTEVLGVFGIYGKTFTIIVMCLYVFTSFWFFYFATGTSFTIRILAFTAITAFLWIIINYFSLTPAPFLHMATYGVKAGMVACGLFIVTVSHEIVAAFVSATTQNPRANKSLNHFLIISIIYLINLALAYSVHFGFIKWNIVTINIFLLLTISGVLGIWGIRQRHKTYEGIIDADPYAVFAFLLTGALAFSTIALFMLNANDTAISAITDIIIFSHIGFGLIFLTYVFSNFAGMLAQNYQVYKVMYSPNNMPFFTFRFAGLITTIALAMYNTWQIPVNNAISGYYNELGDLYLKLQNTQIAKAYYEEARTRGYRGHHANYALANIEGGLFNATDENKFYDNATVLRPTQMSYLNLAQTYQSAGESMQAILSLNEGIRKMKEHDALQNSLALLYAKVGMPDSAMKYLSADNPNRAGLETLGLIPTSDTVSKHTYIKELPKDTILTLAQAAGISNHLVTNHNNDTTFIHQVISLARRPSNDGFKEALLFASAIDLYNSGETKSAFTTLEEVTVTSQHQGRYNNTLAMWALENDEPERAVDYADYAVRQDYKPGKITYAVALTESKRFTEAIVEWDSLRTRGDSLTNILANQLYHALRDVRQTLSIEELYIYSRYRLTAADSNEVFEIVRVINNDNLKAKTLLDLAEKLYALDKPAATITTLQKIVGLELTDTSIGKRMQVLELLARVQLGYSTEVVAALSKDPLSFAGKDAKYKVYFDALGAQDSTAATSSFKWLGTENPYFEDGIIAAAKYFSKKGNTSYNILADARLHHPSSIRIQKAYVLESARQGLESYAKNALIELQSKISARDYSELSQQVNALLAVEH